MSLSAGRVGVRADQVDSHGRVISPSFLNEIMEDLPEWTDLPVRVNGTEQLIPSNPSVPVTSPILADIDYPDIRRNNQYFTHRESPTTVDGLAKIKGIKGNTLVWNQLVPTNWMATASAGATFTSNGDGSYTINGTTNNNLFPARNVAIVPQLGHKYYVKLEKSGGDTIRVAINGTQIYLDSDGILEYSTASANPFFVLYITNGNTFDNVTIKPQIFDLTAMGLNVTADQFRALFPLPYYAYNSGSLLSFNGTGIKTKGKNQLKLPSSATLNGITFTVGTDGQIQITGTATAQTDFYLCGAAGIYNDLDIISSTYTFSCRKDSTTTGLNFFMVGLQTGTKIGVELNDTFKSQTVALDGSDKYRVFMRVANGATINTKVALQLEFGTTATEYEPYTETTTNLPTLTYFPTGMKSAGSIYDELTPAKAITRVGVVDLGSMTWTNPSTAAGTSATWTQGDTLSDAKYSTDPAYLSNGTCIYTMETANGVYSGRTDNSICINQVGRVQMRSSAFLDKTGTEIKALLSGVYLYYELATPVELPTLSFE